MAACVAPTSLSFACGDGVCRLRAVMVVCHCRVRAGVYHFDSIDLGRKSQLLVTAPTEIRIANRLLPGRSATISPAANSGLGAADLLIFVGGVG